MKKLRHVCINGEWFTIKNKVVKMSKSRFGIWITAECDRSQIFRWYKKPSDTKLAIWLDWCDWTNSCFAPYIKVRSANPNVFTIEGLILYEGIRYYIDITPTHNYLYPIEVVEDDLF